MLLAFNLDINLSLVARTPAKLTKLLKEQQSVPEDIVSSNLQIVTGSSTDINAVKSILAHNPAVIISGLGGSPKMRLALFPFTIDQPTICSDSTNVMLTALHELEREQKLSVRPFYAVVSTTGISPRRDVPWLFVGLYYWALHVPHMDKKAMEDAGVEEAMKRDGVLSGFTTIRASLLTDGAKKGLDAVKVGWEKHPGDVNGEQGPGPAIGYTISRRDVGNWMFERLVKGSAMEWNRRMVTVTH